MNWEKIVVHHSASGYGNAIEIDNWHRHRRPIPFTCIGYHYVINNGFNTSADLKSNSIDTDFIGAIEYGRSLNDDEWVDANEVGAHALGFNRESIGICLIHKSRMYHPKMIASLIRLLGELCNKHKIHPSNIFGHYELDDKKPYCPSINMEFMRELLIDCCVE